MIADYSIRECETEFCCEGATCEKYIKKGMRYVLFIELSYDINNMELITHKECLECAKELIEEDMDERAMVLNKVEHLL